jgi:hypothetical protein
MLTATFYPILTSTSLFLQLSVYPTLHMTLSHCLPCTGPSLCYPTDFYIPYQMLLTSLIRKHMYSYISENNLDLLTK